LMAMILVANPIAPRIMAINRPRCGFIAVPSPKTSRQALDNQPCARRQVFAFQTFI
jgi:hypothetical protein